MKINAVRVCVNGCFAVLACAASAQAAAQDTARLALGEKVFVSSCKSCHDTGKPQNDAPQLSAQAEWNERSGKGHAELYRSAIDGFSGYYAMPPRGGNAALSDDDVKAAVDYLLQHAGIR